MTTRNVATRLVAADGPDFPTPIRHVIVIMDENQNLSSVLEQPYEAYLAGTYGFSSQFYAVHHNSDPAYKAATSGLASQGFSVSDATNVGDLADAVNETWYGYDESMPRACDSTTNWTAGYDRDHNPFIMLADVADNTSRCGAHDLSLDAWNASLAAGDIPNYAFITPNVWDDAHNGTLGAADRWLHNFLTPLVNNSSFASTAFIVTYDESTLDDNSGYNGTDGGHIYTVVVSPYSKGISTAHPYNTWDILTTTEWLLGLGRTGNNDSWSVNPPMKDLFNLSAAAQYPVTGEVSNVSSGSPVLRATIAAAGTTDSTASNASGEYVLELPNGTYEVQASAPGFHGETQSVRVAGRPVDPLDFRLNPTTVEAGLPQVRPDPVDLGTNVTISERASGGTGNYSYAWTGLPPGCASVAASFSCMPSSTGDFELRVTVNDSNGSRAMSSATGLTVLPDPELGPIVLSPAGSGADLGTRVTFTVASSVSGSGNVSYTWTGLPTGCLSSDTTAVTCVPMALGTSLVTVTVADSEGRNARSSLWVTVHPDPHVTLTASPSADDVGRLLRVQALPAGGTGPFTYAWIGLPAPCQNANAGNVTCAPTQTGNFTLGLNVTDADGNVAPTTLGLAVNPYPAITRFVADPSNVTLGQSIQLEADAAGGSGALNFSYAGLPPGCAPADQALLVCTPTAPGTFQVRLLVSDDTGANVTASLVLIVLPVHPGSGATAGSGTLSVLDLLVFATAVGLTLGIMGPVLVRGSPRQSSPKSTRTSAESRPNGR